MNRTVKIAFLAVASSLPMGSPAQADAMRKWPLKNGDFSIVSGPGRQGELGGLPNGWILCSLSGKHSCTMGAAEFLRPAGVIVSTVERGRAALVQDVSLSAGDYRLVVEVLEEGYSRGAGDIQLSVSTEDGTITGEPVRVGNAWAKLTLAFSAPNGMATIRLGCNAPAGNAMKFKSAELTIKRLESGAVLWTDGGSLGAIVVGEDPTQAEEYAAYELQRYISKMTGTVIGLQGRDQIHDGAVIHLGQAAAPQQLETLAHLARDSYIVNTSADEITLAGNTPRGTLYAAYDFLEQQGCRWIMPGELGEVVPRLKTLTRMENRLESPDYDCRGFMVMAQEFYPSGGQGSWRNIDFDAYHDWFARNRLNAIWHGGTESFDLGAHRGHGWVQLLNHSYNNIIAPHQQYFEEHPEWYPLVDGVRMPVCNLAPQFANQLCVSNQALRDYTVALAREHFRDNPQSEAFPLSPMDGPSFWCECPQCKALDPSGIDWSEHRSKGHVDGMADRALNYANHVARRVSDVYPGKFIEMYAYGYTLTPPVREKAHPNVLIKYANLSGGRGTGPLGVSMMESEVAIWQQWRQTLDGWKRAQAKLAFYNYLEWEHQDVTLFWFYNTVDMLKNLNRHYNCRALMGETENDQNISVMQYNILAQAAWDVDTDYRAVIRDVCDHFYGPAADEMYDYNILMSDAINDSTAWQEPKWRPNEHRDLSFAVLARGRQMLAEAQAKIAGDAMLERRLAYAHLGHATLTYVRALTEPNKTHASARMARDAFGAANAVREEHDLMVQLATVPLLESFSYPQVTGRVVLDLPQIWDFRRDPDDIGITAEWFKQDGNGAWDTINITQAWTEQPAGADYHGAAWYHTSFALPPDRSDGVDLVLSFGAVDGYVDVYLDGVKIGEQKKDVNLMWDQPFTVPFPAEKTAAATHHLAIRVEKDSFAAGIWKAVTIAEAVPADEPKEPTAQGGGRVDW